MLKNKKAQGLSLNTIIIAAIVLIVLVVLIMVFTGRMGWFTRGIVNATNEMRCVEDLGGQELPESECPLYCRILLPLQKLEEGKVCCKPDCE